MGTAITPEEFITVFSDAFDDNVKNRISMNTPFKHIEGWSSLLALLITVNMNEKWNFGFSDEELRMCNTVKELYQVALQKTNQ